MAYLKHFTGPIIWLAPLMIPIEIISHLSRPLSLTLRLFGNITGEELVLGVLMLLCLQIFLPFRGRCKCSLFSEVLFKPLFSPS